MGKSTPEPPNPYRVAAAQSGANKEAIQESAKVNAVDQYAPWGQTTFQRDSKGVPTSQTIALGPSEQQFYDLSGQIRNTLGGKAQTLLDFIPSDKYEPTANGDAVAKALYDRRYNMMKPQLEEAENAFWTTMSDRGIPIGSEIYDKERGRLERGRNEMLGALAQDAILASGAEEDRQIARDLTLRAQPFNEVSAFLQGAPAMASPGFQQTPAYQQAAVPIGDYINNAYNQQVAQSNARNSGLASGLFGLGSAVIGLSDRRMKTDIRRIGQLDNGVPIYGYRYVSPNSPYYIGVMAQDVEGVVPAAVVTAGNDIKMVNYEALAASISPEAEAA